MMHLNRLIVLCMTALVLVSCKKEEEPAPPPPPPPPPPMPDPIDMDALRQDIGDIDARVDVASGVQIYDRDFAEACLHLADALAKGDAEAMGEHLTADAKGVLDTLQNDGRWYEATPSIERVRIVHIESLINGSPASPRDEPDSGMLVMAVQQPSVAYVLGWMGDASQGWDFDGLPTTSDTRTRAVQWDGLMLAEYLVSQDDLAGAMQDLEGTEGDLEDLMRAAERAFDNQGAPEETPSRDGTRKNTPGGPVTIPGG